MSKPERRRNMVPYQFLFAAGLLGCGYSLGAGAPLIALVLLAVAVWAGCKIDDALEPYGFFRPSHTVESVARDIYDGLKDGSVTWEDSRSVKEAD